jgi:hypothetical protein
MLGRLDRIVLAPAAIAAALTCACALAGSTSAAAQERIADFTDQTGEFAGGRIAGFEAAAAPDALRVRLEQLSETEVKQFYLGCSGAAMSGRLGGGETAACSVVYDVLLKRHFDGDFGALLAWSRGQAHDGGVPAMICN